MIAMCCAVIRRELVVAFRRKTDIFNPLWFFILVITLFPLSVGPDHHLLSRIAPGIIWVAALLSALLSLERMYKDDLQDGALEQLMMMPLPLPVGVFAKIVAHWLLTGVPLLIISPVLAILLSLNLDTWLAMVCTLLLGTPVLSFIGAIGVALTVGLNKGGVLLSLLVLPLYIPVLIFATSAMDVAAMGGEYAGQLAILAAMAVLTIVLAPLAISAALRVSVR